MWLIFAQIWTVQVHPSFLECTICACGCLCGRGIGPLPGVFWPDIRIFTQSAEIYLCLFFKQPGSSVIAHQHWLLGDCLLIPSALDLDCFRVNIIAKQLASCSKTNAPTLTRLAPFHWYKSEIDSYLGPRVCIVTPLTRTARLLSKRI